MIRITRQGVSTAVVQVDVDGLSATTPEGQKDHAKQTAVATMRIMGWSGTVTAKRATLDAQGKFYSVTVGHVKPKK